MQLVVHASCAGASKIRYHGDAAASCTEALPCKQLKLHHSFAGPSASRADPLSRNFRRSRASIQSRAKGGEQGLVGVVVGSPRSQGPGSTTLSAKRLEILCNLENSGLQLGGTPNDEANRTFGSSLCCFV
jgi:hypothetical protein